MAIGQRSHGIELLVAVYFNADLFVLYVSDSEKDIAVALAVEGL